MLALPPSEALGRGWEPSARDDATTHAATEREERAIDANMYAIREYGDDVIGNVDRNPTKNKLTKTLHDRSFMQVEVPEPDACPLPVLPVPWIPFFCLTGYLTVTFELTSNET